MTTRLTHATTLSLAIVLAIAPSPALYAQQPEESGTASSDSETTAASKDSLAPTVEKKDEGDHEKRKLSDRIKAVERKVFLKKSRFEIFPHFAMGLNDSFFQHLIVGAAVGYHIADSASIELRGGYVFSSLKQSVITFVRNDAGAVLNNPPKFKYHADIDFLWAPLYGKLSLMSESILHFDTYVTAGPGVFGTDLGANPAVNVGIGQRYFITDWLVARIELRDYVFVESGRESSSKLQNMLILGFALSGFLPTEFQYEYQ